MQRIDDAADSGGRNCPASRFTRGMSGVDPRLDRGGGVGDGQQLPGQPVGRALSRLDRDLGRFAQCGDLAFDR